MSDSYKLKRLAPTFTLSLHGESDARPLLFSATVRQIGRGRFTTAFRDTAKPEIVYLAVNEEAGDYSKRILMDTDVNPYIPLVSHLGELGNRELFSVAYVERLKANRVKAWKEYKALAAARELAWNQIAVPAITKHENFVERGCDVNTRTIELLSGGGAPGELLEALESLQSASCNYGASYVFEFAPRNLGTNGDQLILIDPVFDLRTIHQQQESARKRAQAGKGGW